jgi:two-component system sensor histidine kinase YesM
MLRKWIHIFLQWQIHFLRQFTVKRRLFFTFLIISIAPLAIVATVSFYYSYKDAMQKNESFSLQVIQQIEINTESLITNYEALLQSITNEDVIQSDMKIAASFSKLEQYSLDDKIKKMLNAKMMSNFAIEGVSVSLINDLYSMYVGNRILPPLYSKTSLYLDTLSNAKQSFTWLPPHVNEVPEFFQTGKKVLTLSMPIQDRWRGTNFGIAVFQKIFAGLDKPGQGKVFIIDASGTVIYNEKESEWGEPLLDPKLAGAIYGSSAEKGLFNYRTAEGSRFLTSFTKINNNQWTVVNQISYDYLLKNTNKILIFTVAISISFMLLCVYVALLVFTSIFSSIYGLMKSMRNLEKGDFQLSVEPHSGKDEIQRLISAYYRMVERLNDMISQLFREKLAKQEMQIKALKAQINPHFLYNTLETISSLAKIHNVHSISKMTTSLSHIFHYSITGEEDFVPLRDEIRSVEHYLRIIHFRYGDRMSSTIAIPESLYASKVLKLILQPLVENAVQHGIEPKSSPGTIRVEAFLKEDRLHLIVADNGVGMDSIRLMELKQLLATAEDQLHRTSLGIGLLNVKERLWLAYGVDCSFELYSTEGEGTTIEIILPITTRPKAGDS